MIKTKLATVLLGSMIMIMLGGPGSYAQTVTNTAILQRASVSMRQKETNDFKKLLITAKQKNWPLIITGKNGRKAFLMGMDKKGMPLYVGVNDNIISAATIGTTKLWPGGSTGLSLSGSSASLKSKIAIWDEGIVRPTHVELVGRVQQVDNPSAISDHSTHVSGTMIATGVNPVAKGMAFAAQQLLCYDFNNDVSEMLAASPNILLSNHSYGSIAGWNYNTTDSRWEWWGNFGDTVDYKFGYYDSESQMWDSISYNAPYYLIVKSAGNNRDENGPAVGQPYFRFNASNTMVNAGNRPAGISNNDGYDIIPTYGTAKNILTVGAVNPIPGGYTQPSDVVLSSFSSWGPTDDGRIKPDVVTDGVDVLSCIGTSDNAYAIYSGTSMASPAATGSSLILQEYYSKLHSGNFMRSATLRGLLIHTADEAGTSAGPDYSYGWGLVDIPKAASVITSNNTDQILQENNLISGSSYTLPVVASGKGPLVVTICWTDPAGTVDEVNILNNPAKKLINDLDVRVTQGSSTYYPYILDRKNPANPATTGDDTLNNVEKIVIANPIAGKSYNISVTHKATLQRGQQAYTLLVSGVGGSAYCASAPTSSAGSRIDSVSISNIANANPAGCTTYTDYTASQVVSLQSNQTIPFRIKVSSCDASVASKALKIFVDYKNDGLFTDAGDTAYTSPVISGNGVFSGTITTPAGLTVGNLTRMRIVLEETTNPSVIGPCNSYGNGETEDYGVQVISPSTDAGIGQLIDPPASACASDSQRLTVRVRNFGTSLLLNVPISVTILKDSSTVATFNAICPDSIPALSDVVYTLQPTFATTAGNTYTVVCTTTLTGDQNPLNNSDTSSMVVSSGSTSTATGEAEICNADSSVAALKASLTDSTDVAIWYNSATATVPIAAGNKTTTTVIPANKTYYMALNDVSSNVGPVNNKVLLAGGYNEYSGNYVNFTSSVPLTIQSARLYISHGGTITFTVADIQSVDESTGSFTYLPISSNTLTVYPTTPNVQSGAIGAIDPSDTGAVYYLNLPVPTPGSHSIIIDCEDGAGIFRNNNIASNPYPFTIPGLFSITGNSAVNTSDTTDVTFYQKYYYFFYDMRIALNSCPSPRVPVVATTPAAPVISLSGSTLTSSIASGNQWYLNDSLLSGATAQTDTISVPGSYKTAVTDSMGCTIYSNTILYSPKNPIGLLFGPNPNNGTFNLSFYVNPANDVSISVVNTLGQRLYTENLPNYSGVYSKTITLSNVSAGVYFLKLQVGSNHYVEKISVK